MNKKIDIMIIERSNLNQFLHLKTFITRLFCVVFTYFQLSCSSVVETFSRLGLLGIITLPPTCVSQSPPSPTP